MDHLKQLYTRTIIIFSCHKYVVPQDQLLPGSVQPEKGFSTVAQAVELVLYRISDLVAAVESVYFPCSFIICSYSKSV